MNKKIITIIICIVLIISILAILYNILIKKEKTNNIKDVQIDNNTNNKNLISMNEIEMPDEIIYYKDGNKIIIQKENEKFDRIISLNRDRNIGDLLMLELVVGDIKEDTPNVFLEYKYNNDSSIYFTLESTQEDNYIWVSEGSKKFVSGAYGHIGIANELTKYLEINT